MIPFASNPNKSYAILVTSNARVESSPPDKPSTACFVFICSNLFFRPWA